MGRRKAPIFSEQIRVSKREYIVLKEYNLWNVTNNRWTVTVTRFFKKKRTHDTACCQKTVTVQFEMGTEFKIWEA
jgi:hypothetical protein